MRSPLVLLLAASAAFPGCSGGIRATDSEARVRPSCALGTSWGGQACVSNRAGQAALTRGVAAVAAFKPEEAVRELDAARASSPHTHETLVRIYEQLGIAHAYLGDENRARAAFISLLTLSPKHLLSYTLSPKVTFLFERVRRDQSRPQPPAVDLSWPRDLTVTEPIPVDVEVITDPEKQMVRATLELRRKGDTGYRSIDLSLVAPGSYRRVLLPRLGGDRPDVLQLHLRAFDSNGNEIHRWGSAQRPREIALGFERPVPWYRKWWVWAIAGSAVTVSTGLSVYLIQKEPPATVDGGLSSTR